MKKIILILCSLFLLSPVIFGQTKSKKVDIFWGNPQKTSKKSILDDVIGYDESGFYCTRLKITGLYGMNTSYAIEHYNNKMELTKSVDLELKDNNQERDIEMIIHYNNKLLLFSNFQNKKQKKKYLFYQSIDKETLQPNKDLKKISEIDYEGSSNRNSGNFNYSISNDSSKFLVYQNLPYIEGENEKFGLTVFDNNINEIWQKNITLPYNEELFGIEDFVIDNDGNVYVMGILFKEKQKFFSKNKRDYKYQIIRISPDEDDLKEIMVDLNDKFITDMTISVNNKSEIIGAGFYTSKEKAGYSSSSIDGCLFVRIDSKTGSVISDNYKEFDIDFITQNMTDKQKNKVKSKEAKGKEIEMPLFNLRDIIMREDGGAILIGEQYYVEVITSTSTSANGTTTTTTTYRYNYNDIIVINISPEGVIEWAKKVAKRQVSTNDFGASSSYALAVVKDKIYFIFNDNPTNLYYSGKGAPATCGFKKSTAVVLVEMDADGDQKREALFDAKETQVMTKPKLCSQISDDQMILYGMKGLKTYRFARLTFK